MSPNRILSFFAAAVLSGCGTHAITFEGRLADAQAKRAAISVREMDTYDALAARVNDDAMIEEAHADDEGRFRVVHKIGFGFGCALSHS